MAQASSRFAMLLDLAKENSSDKRRELLRNVTDMFLSDPTGMTGANCAAFDEIVGAVVSDLESDVRFELSRTLSESPLPLGKTARQLAMDDIEIARPMIERSNALTETDLLDVVATKSQDHMLAMTKRTTLGERVSGALVERGEDNVVASLLSNNGAKIDRVTYEKVAERAQTSTVLHAPFVRRQSVPLDLLNDVYASVAGDLRQEILKRYETVSPDELDAALERSKTKLSKAYGALPQDFETQQRQLRKLEREGTLNPSLLVRLMREGVESRTLFLLAFGKLADAQFAVVARVFDSKDIDALALLCRAAGFDRALFVTLSLAVAGEDRGLAKVEEFSALYEKVPLVSAQRAVRFWKVRASAA
jgi:uncharacterized protein (DUF2336 family)